MKVTGLVKHKLAKVTGEGNSGTWEKQTLVIEEQGKYTNDVAIDFFNKLDLIADLKAGQSVTVSVNLKSREYNGRWFTNVDGWKVEAGTAEAEEPAEVADVVSDDLPF